MRKRLAIVGVVVVMVFVLAGCGGTKQITESINESISEVVESVKQVISGDITGEIGVTYATDWFDFTIDSVKKVGEYAGYAAESGYQLVAVKITETGTFDEPSPMGTFDFYMDSVTFDEYVYPLEALDDTMMPEEFMLAKDQTVSYYMIYEIPEDFSDLKLIYVEVDETNATGNVFTINLSL